MTSWRIARAIGGLTLLGVLTTAAVLAQVADDKRTLFTFNRPITLPGVTLPAGQYLFRIVDNTTNRKVVQVLSSDGKKPYAMLLSIPDTRPDPSTSPEVRFMETGAGTPSAVKTWWYPNERIGYEFIYPKDQARMLARGEVQPILTTRTETTKPAETKTAELERLAPTGEETPVAAAAPEPAAPAGPAQPGVVASEAIVIPAPVLEARAELPRTASTLPLVGLIGILALSTAGGLRLWKVARA
jgi:hypothetical protein